MSVALKPGLISVAEFEELGAAGEFQRLNNRVELIRGVVVPMSPVGGPQVRIVTQIQKLLWKHLGEQVFVTCQGPIRLFDSEPQPDLLVSSTEEEKGLDVPEPDTSLLVIEVSDSTYRHDVNVKLPLYAEVGIPEVWIVNIAARQIEVYRQPDVENACYVNKNILGLGAVVNISAFPEVKIEIDEIFRPLLNANKE